MTTEREGPVGLWHPPSGEGKSDTGLDVSVSLA